MSVSYVFFIVEKQKQKNPPKIFIYETRSHDFLVYALDRYDYLTNMHIYTRKHIKLTDI